jgi:hypothetical protein
MRTATAVGMSAQLQIEAGVSGVAINLRGMGQQDRKGIGRNVRGRLFDIIDLIIMRLSCVQASQTPF